jgi:putative hemolysin
MLVDLVIIIVLLVVNGVLAMSEIAIVASRKVRLEARAEAGSRGARTALRLARNPGRFLSTVQTGVSLIGILLGALSDTAVSAPIALSLHHVTWMSPSVVTATSFIVGITITTFVSLIVGELVPKQIALRRAEAIAVVVARPLAIIAQIIFPAVALLDVASLGVLRLLGIHRVQRELVTEAEVRTLIEEGTEHGVFHPSEGAMVGRVLRFADRPVRSIMTPRASMVWVDINAGPTEIARIMKQSRHTRLPVGRGSENDIVGLIDARYLLRRALEGKPLSIGEGIEPLPAIFESTPVLQTLEVLQKAGARMGLVVDEYGGVEGIVTLADMLEAIVGDLPEASRREQPEIVAQQDGSLIVDGLVAIEDLKVRLGLQAMPGEDEVSTVGGFMLTRLGRLPRVGDKAHYASYSFEVLSMDGRRINKLSVARDAASPGEDEGG